MGVRGGGACESAEATMRRVGCAKRTVSLAIVSATSSCSWSKVLTRGRCPTHRSGDTSQQPHPFRVSRFDSSLGWDEPRFTADARQHAGVSTTQLGSSSCAQRAHEKLDDPVTRQW